MTKVRGAELVNGFLGRKLFTRPPAGRFAVRRFQMTDKEFRPTLAKEQPSGRRARR